MENCGDTISKVITRSTLAIVVSLFFQFPLAAAETGQTYYVQGKAVSRQVYDSNVILNQGILLLRENQNLEAMDKFEQVLSINPDMAVAHHSLALSFGKMGKNDQALAEFQKAISLDPTLDVAWLSLGALYQTTGRVEDAIQTYKEFLVRFPKNSEASKVKNLLQGLERLQPNVKDNTKSIDRANNADENGDYFAIITTNGVHRWPANHMPIKVFIASGSGIFGYKPEYLAIVQQCFQDWQAAGRGKVGFTFVKQPGQADIELNWLSDPKKLANSAEAGETKLIMNHAGIVRGKIQLLTVPLTPDLPLTDNRLRTIALHEIGHVLGMTGHTANPKEIMFYSSSITDDYRQLTARDINTLMRLYSEQ